MTQPTLPMDEQQLPPRNHNNPPADLPYDAEALGALKADVDAFVQASDVWTKTEITSDTLAGQCADQITGLRELFKKVDGARKDAKKPHDDAGKAVQAAFAPLLDLVTRSAEALKPRLAKYEAEKRAKAAAEEAECRAEAARQAEQARLASLEAEQSGSIADQQAAEEAQKAAEQAEKAAARKIDTSIRSASGAGRTMAVRKTKHAVINNAGRLFLAVKDEPEILEALQRVANRLARSKDFSGELPGCTIEERETIA